MTQKQGIVLPKNCYIHIDKIHAVGPCKHRPIGQVNYKYDEELGFSPSVAFRTEKQLKDGADSAFFKSGDIGEDGYAYKLEIHCCPPKVLQKHNVFGHSNLVDYLYKIFDRAVRVLGIDAEEHDRAQWRQGFVWLTVVHLTANFACPDQYVVPIIDAIDANNRESKQRPLTTSISLGYSGDRRSRHRVATIYYKLAELLSEWKRCGEFKTLLMNSVKDAIRVELKLFDMGLKAHELQYAAAWKDINVADLFFSELAKFNIAHSIQPLLTPEQMAVLSTPERNVYLLWLHGVAIADQFDSRSSVWKYTKAIEEKTGIVVSGNRRPEALPAISILDILSPQNVLPIPNALFGTEFYCPPGGPELPPLRGGSLEDEDPNGEKWILVEGEWILI